MNALAVAYLTIAVLVAVIVFVYVAASVEDDSLLGGLGLVTIALVCGAAWLGVVVLLPLAAGGRHASRWVWMLRHPPEPLDET